MLTSAGMRRFGWDTHNLFPCRTRDATRDDSTGSLAHLDGRGDTPTDKDIQRDNPFAPFRFFF